MPSNTSIFVKPHALSQKALRKPLGSAFFSRTKSLTATAATSLLVVIGSPKAIGQPVNQLPVITVAKSANGFSPTGNLITERRNHTATLLKDGKVLVTGGWNDTSVYLSSSELYDPATETWTTTGSLKVARFFHKAVLLRDGRVLVAGGLTEPFSNPGTVEIYQPSTRKWTTASALAGSRYGHTLTLLTDGKILVAGEERADIYDPSKGTWSITGSPGAWIEQHASVLLPNGKVLAGGGYTNLLSQDRLYDPATGSWTATGRPLVPRRFFSAVLLNNGQVLATGGQGVDTRLDSAERYDPLSGQWSTAGTFQNERSSHTTTLLGDGRVLVVGGFDNHSKPVASPHLYDPDLNAWFPVTSPTAARSSHTATLLMNGSVLLTGGINGTTLGTAETYGLTSDVVGTEGSPVVQQGMFSDTEGQETVTFSASSGTVTPDMESGKWHWTATGSDGPAVSTIHITATDTSGGTAASHYRFIVNNAVPAVDIAALQSGMPTTPISFNFTATDPSEADQTAGFEWSIDFGDGTPAETTPTGVPSPLVRTHTFAFGGTYTVAATATDKDSGTSSEATRILTIPGKTALEAWREHYFGRPDNSNEGSDQFDADKDGLVNLVEFAFGLDPTSGASSQLPAAQRRSRTLLLAFEQPQEASGCIAYRAEWSDNLLDGNWKPAADFGTHGSHEFRVPSAGYPKMFIRMIVTRTAADP